MVIIVKENEDGKIELTEEQLKKIVEDAREEGRRSVQTIPGDYDKYEKMSYWMRPDYVPPQVTCNPVIGKDIPISTWDSQKINTYYTLKSDTSM